jgi:intermembrane space import and assembly protein 40
MEDVGKKFLHQNMPAEKDIIIFEEQPQKQEGSSTRSGESSQEQNMNEAFDPETNEINWDCPCIADLVKPPCGDSFKEAFSCFVYSKEEPRGSDCIEQFKSMQTCFMKYPEIYGDDEEDEDDEQDSKEAVKKEK